MHLVEFTVFAAISPADSKRSIAVNPETVIRVGSMGMPPDHSFIKFVDGGSVEVVESYETVVSRLKVNE